MFNIDSMTFLQGFWGKILRQLLYILPKISDKCAMHENICMGRFMF